MTQTSEALAIVGRGSGATGLRTVAENRGWRVLVDAPPAMVLREVFHLNPVVALVEVSRELGSGPELMQVLCEHARRPQVVALISAGPPNRGQMIERRARIAGACCCLPLEAAGEEIEQIVDELLVSHRSKLQSSTFERSTFSAV